MFISSSVFIVFACISLAYVLKYCAVVTFLCFCKQQLLIEGSPDCISCFYKSVNLERSTKLNEGGEGFSLHEPVQTCTMWVVTNLDYIGCIAPARIFTLVNSIWILSSSWHLAYKLIRLMSIRAWNFAITSLRIPTMWHWRQCCKCWKLIHTICQAGLQWQHIDWDDPQNAPSNGRRSTLLDIENRSSHSASYAKLRLETFIVWSESSGEQVIAELRVERPSELHPLKYILISHNYMAYKWLWCDSPEDSCSGDMAILCMSTVGVYHKFVKKGVCRKFF